MCNIESNCNAVNDIKEIRQAITKIQDALVGNEYYPHGALARIADVEMRIDDIRKQIDRIRYIALGYAIGGAGIGAAILKVFSLL